MAPVSEKPVMCSYVKEHRIMCFISIIIFFFFFGKKGRVDGFVSYHLSFPKPKYPLAATLLFINQSNNSIQ